jgi:hypothetical protein
VFEFSLFDFGDSRNYKPHMDEALSAILSLYDLEVTFEQTLKQESSAYEKSSMVNKIDGSYSYQICISALISHCCHHGHLEWLYGLPSVMLTERLGYRFPLKKYISKELEYLANTVDVLHIHPGFMTLSSDFVPSAMDRSVNYYELLCVLYINHREYKEAAQVMHSLATRILSECQLLADAKLNIAW